MKVVDTVPWVEGHWETRLFWGPSSGGSRKRVYKKEIRKNTVSSVFSFRTSQSFSARKTR